MEGGLAEVEQTMRKMKLWKLMGHHKPISNVKERVRTERFKLAGGR